MSLLPWELAEADRTSRVKKRPGKSRDTRIQILTWQKREGNVRGVPPAIPNPSAEDRCWRSIKGLQRAAAFPE